MGSIKLMRGINLWLTQKRFFFFINNMG